MNDDHHSSDIDNIFSFLLDPSQVSICRVGTYSNRLFYLQHNAHSSKVVLSLNHMVR